MSNISLSWPRREASRAWQLYLLPAVLLISGLTVWTDYLQAGRMQASFYISESALFSIFWCFFPPMFYLQQRILRARQLKTHFRMGLSIALPILFHALGYASLVNLLGKVFLGHGFQWISTLTYALTEFYHVLIIGYTLPVVLSGRRGVFRSSWAESTTAGNTGAEVAESSHPVMAPEENSNRYLQVMSIRDGLHTIFVPVQDVICIQASSPYLKVQLAKRIHLHAGSLRWMESKLDPGEFVRVHKSTIVRRDAVCKMISRANGDYDLLLCNGQEVRMSRRYVQDFRMAAMAP